MEESSKEQQLRCPCGFWGSPKTLGLCSKCYREAQRNQPQSSLSDPSKSSLGSCHSQSRNCITSKNRMDSKHLPSHSTTDNLPSSLSSPGERPALAAAASHPPVSVESTNVTNSSTNTGPSNMSGAVLGSNSGELCPPGTLDTHLPTSSDSDTQSLTSSDQTYDPVNDADSRSSVSCTSLASVPSSIGNTTPSSSSTVLPNDGSIQNDTQEVPTKSAVLGSKNALTEASSLSSQGVNTTDNLTDSVVIVQSNLAASSTINSSVKCADSKEQASCSTANKASPAVSTVEKCEKNTCEDDSCQEAPSAKGVKRTREEMEASSGNELLIQSEPSPQKNKRRCHTCSCKLELAQRTIGRCRCDRVFCALHRLPELHHCEFNHKEDGRREAREKMIKPTRHLGPSFRREDHL